MKKTVTVGGKPVGVEVTQRGDTVEARIDGTIYRATLSRDGDRWQFALADRMLVLTVVREREQAWVAVDGELYRCVVADAAQQTDSPAGVLTPRVAAPMPGKVLEVAVREGQQVSAGDPLVVLEAMKMETVATAEAAARVVRVCVSTGETVEPGQTLVELEYTPAQG